MPPIPGLVYLHFKGKTKLVRAAKMHESYSVVERYIQTQFPEAQDKPLEIKIDMDGMRDVSISRDAWCRFVDAQVDGTIAEIDAYTVEVEPIPQIGAESLLEPASSQVVPRGWRPRPPAAAPSISDPAGSIQVPAPNVWRRSHPPLAAPPAYPSSNGSDTFNITVKTVTGKHLSIAATANDTVDHLKVKIQDKEGTPPDQQRIRFRGRHLMDDETLQGCGLQTGSIVHLELRLRGGKPVVYLRAPKVMDATVRVSLVPEWSFSAIYPVAFVEKPEGSALHHAVSWSVRVRADGTLVDKGTGTEVSYLFWEAETNAPDQLSPPPSPVLGSIPGFRPAHAFEAFKRDSSVLLAIKRVPLYLDSALRELGLDTEARTSFITFWLPSLLPHAHVLLSFLSQAAYEKSAPLKVEPVPDATTRVFMVFRGVAGDEVGGETAGTLPAVIAGPATPQKTRKRGRHALTPSSTRRASKRIQVQSKENAAERIPTNQHAAAEDVFCATSAPSGALPRFRLKVPKAAPAEAPKTFTSTHRLFSVDDSTHYKHKAVEAFNPFVGFGPDSNDRDAQDDEHVDPAFDELRLLGPGELIGGDGYPRPAPPAEIFALMSETERRRFQFTAPAVSEATAALIDLNVLLRGEKRGPNSAGFKPLEFDEWERLRINGIRTMLSLYTNPRCPSTYLRWGEAAIVAARTVGRDEYCGRRFAALARAFVLDRKVLPINPYGAWTASLMSDEGLAADVSGLLHEREYITAETMREILSLPEIREKHDIRGTISLRSACRHLDKLGYAYSFAKKGQYQDGHDRDDVKKHRDEVYLPALKGYEERAAYYEDDGTIVVPRLPPGVRRSIIWYHDESIFYAHDRRFKMWRPRDGGAKPYQKGDGHSFMVADYVSADFGWLRGENGQSARRTMRPGKNRDGYFTGAEVEEQAQAAALIVTQRWPEFEHVFVYDNATTHHKRGEGALSAVGMPMKISGFVSEATKKRNAEAAARGSAGKQEGEEGEVGEEAAPDATSTAAGDSGAGKKKRKPRRPPAEVNFLVKVNDRNEDGSAKYDTHGNLVKKEVRMTGASFKDGSPQDLYLPETHDEYPGKFKGMHMLLEERRARGDLGELSSESLAKLRAECPSFKCADPASHSCCMRRMLFNQPDFSAVKSCLEEACASFGVAILFLPKFHPELNPIEMCWGYAKRVYRLKPESGREYILEKNTIASLDAVPLESIRKFARRTSRFGDAYRKGLTGAQAAWACRKYKGHRALPRDYLEAIKEANLGARGKGRSKS
ncbi:hypothetical protein MKEN_01489100 [Mycena kentingensis (nom. inval.)]|nr:hypothetical protein MKEN_01489100 [Mycena kentingensis (nom. inval.)]